VINKDRNFETRAYKNQWYSLIKLFTLLNFEKQAIVHSAVLLKALCEPSRRLGLLFLPSPFKESQTKLCPERSK
jgi:hypothetical protein